MLEKEIERQLVKSVKAKNGLCLKFNCLSMNGVPDRVILMPDGKIAFVEVKAPGKKLRRLQIKRKKQFECLGFDVFVLDHITHIDEMIARLEKKDGICTT
ncbi:VRR-NUC domain-containing protein [Granulicatella sp. zg-ZJ]|uniref:VRR-NUC domain-containing protein n=1 Tax=Granulicatella sp. zg-ZJ TaxID=2678504 RepID=UPI0013D14CBA|nr:VRR-NUC domain-containing protein [Granulicatella sp. zg-ZJ]NEW62271.1 VRR-NUC domain-containing protein [Granulicatella sp. zg-ZJ]